MRTTTIFLTFFVAYLLGSISFAHLLARSDDEEAFLAAHGAGASSTFWTRGHGIALLVLLGDFGKGAVATLLTMWFFGPEAGFLAGVAAVIGHNWPLFYHFKGGRGVMTTAGVLLALMPGPLGIGLLVAALAFAVSRNTLVASIMLFGAALTMAWQFEMGPDVIFYSMSLAMAVAVYTLLARRHIPAEERWHSTTLRP